MTDENQAPSVPPTVEAAVWAESALASARALRTALARLLTDHRAELTPWQASEARAARNHAGGAVGALALLVFQLRQATAPPATGVSLHVLPREEEWKDPDPAAWSAAMLAEAPEAPEPTPEETEAAEAQADQDYDRWKNR